MTHKILLPVCLIIALGNTLVAQFYSESITFETWYQNCSQLPSIRTCAKNKLLDDKGNFTDLNNYVINRAHNFTLADFRQTVELFFQTAQNILVQETAWLGDMPCFDTDTMFCDSSTNGFRPFAQKLIVGPDTQVCFHGDLHGDIHSLLAHIKKLQEDGYMDEYDGFKIKPEKNFYMIFLGDYVDKGIYGTEVLYTLMRLKIANPERVILVRGNHEDPVLTRSYGFDVEFKAKFKSDDPLNKITQQVLTEICHEKLTILYNLLPVVLYLGCNNNFVQCCHGGLEIGYNPLNFFKDQTAQFQLLGELQQASHFCQFPDILQSDCSAIAGKFQDFVPEKPIDCEKSRYLGFMWNDFEPEHKRCSFNKLRGFKFNQDFTESALNFVSDADYKLLGVIRAHQHVVSNRDPLMRLLLASHGVARLWQSQKKSAFAFWPHIVITLLVSPDNLYGFPRRDFWGFNYDTALMVRPDSEFARWQGTIVNNKLFPT